MTNRSRGARLKVALLAVVLAVIAMVAAACGSSQAHTPGEANPALAAEHNPSPRYLGLKPTADSRVAIVGAAGDIACPSLRDNGNWSDEEARNPTDACKYPTTAKLLGTLGLDAVLPLGDTQYPDGRPSLYKTQYNAAWGTFKAISYPVVGNHEYGVANASGFYTYFADIFGDSDLGYYSYDIGSWHMIALNSECVHIGGCQAGSPQDKWLKADLAAHPAQCTLAYWHEPRFSSGNHGSNSDFQDLWTTLYNGGVDVVLNGHDHDYERFAPLTPDGSPDPKRGISEFVAGTGGDSLAEFHEKPGRFEPGSVKAIAGQYGILDLALNPGSFSWKFLPIVGTAPLDSGTQNCH